MKYFIAPLLLTGLLFFILGFVTGQSFHLGWGLPIGTSSALVIAASSLVITAYQFFSMRRHNILLVRPHLVFSNTFNINPPRDQKTLPLLTYHLEVKNVGFGPAIIDSFFLSLEGEKILDTDSLLDKWMSFVGSNMPVSGMPGTSAASLRQGEVIEKGKEKTLLRTEAMIRMADLNEGEKIANQLNNKINVTIKYKCHYGTQQTVSK